MSSSDCRSQKKKLILLVTKVATPEQTLTSRIHQTIRLLDKNVLFYFTAAKNIHTIKALCSDNKKYLNDIDNSHEVV